MTIKLWTSIVNTTNSHKELSSLRVHLFNEQRNILKKTFIVFLKENILYMYKVLYFFLFTPKKSARLNFNNKFIFVFPHLTPSNLNNLLPVLLEAISYKLPLICILGGDNKSFLPSKLDDTSIITKKDIISYLSPIEKTIILFNSILLLWHFITLTLTNRYFSNRLFLSIFKWVAYCVESSFIGYSFNKIFQKQKPKIVVSTSDFYPFEHQIFKKANNFSINTFLIQHGLIDYFWHPFTSRYLILWGDSFFKDMVKLNCDIKRILILGMPASDHLFQNKNTPFKNINKPFLNILFLNNTNGRLGKTVSYNYASFLNKICHHTGNYNFIVKLHPNENLEFYEKLNPETRRRLKILPKYTSLFDALNASDVVSTIFSTAGLEGMIKGLPLIILDIDKKVKEHCWWPKFGGGVYCDDYKSFINVLNNFHDKPNYREYILNKQNKFLHNNFINQGRASKVIINHLKDLSDQ